MLQRFKNIYYQQQTLLTNFLAMGLLQGTNFILPYLVIPYLQKTIGNEHYGSVIFAFDLANYLVIIADYGFNFSATREISIHRHDTQKLSEIFSAVITTKVYMMLASLLIFGLLVGFVPSLRAEWSLYVLSLTLFFGQIFLSLWFFQGVEKMMFMTLLNVVIRFSYVVLVFGFVEKPSDYIWINFFQGLGMMMGTLVSLHLIFRQFQVRFRWAGRAAVRQQLHEGLPIFISYFTTYTALNSSVIILKFLTTPTDLGHYAVASRVFFMLRALTNTLYNVVYPRACQIATESFEKLRRFWKMLLLGILAVFLPLCLACWAGAGYIIGYMSKTPSSDSVLMLRILAFLPLVAALGLIPSQTLLAYNFRKTFSLIAVGLAVVNVVSNVLLASCLGAVGTALSVAITEVLSTVLLYFYLHKKHRAYSFLTPKNSSL